MALMDAFRVTLPASTDVERIAIERNIDRHQKITLCMLSASAHVVITIKYLFGNGADAPTEADIQTIALTSGTMTMVNFDFPVGTIQVTYDDDGSAFSAAALKIDLHTAR